MTTGTAVGAGTVGIGVAGIGVIVDCATLIVGDGTGRVGVDTTTTGGGGVAVEAGTTAGDGAHAVTAKVTIEISAMHVTRATIVTLGLGYVDPDDTADANSGSTRLPPSTFRSRS
ncbi:MAG TPA: hypothetical protein VMP10_00425 [Chloroflexota bacterium]|nr:hypothetical protein [Chloroflexota bacterium]